MLDRFSQWGQTALIRHGPRWVCLVLLSLIAVDGGRAIAALTDVRRSATPASSPNVPQAPFVGARGADLAPIMAAHLFGVAPTDPDRKPNSAPPPDAELVLFGTLATQDSTHGLGIIGAKGIVSVLKVGDDLDGASLQAVYRDRVVLNRGGDTETLALPHAANLPGSTGRPSRELASNGVERPDVPGYRSPHDLANVVTAKAALDQAGNLLGFVVHPSRNVAAFNESGLKQDDLVTAIDGSPLAGLDSRRGRALVDGMLASEQGMLTVLRDGQSLNVSVRNSGNLGDEPDADR